MDEVASSTDERKLAELKAIVESIKDRVRAQYPESSVALDPGAAVPISVPLADLMPLVHARDAALAKVAALGSVNPRRGGAANNAIQFVKRMVARGLSWFVRDQITFNRGVIACVEATIEALNEENRSVASLAGTVAQSLQGNRNVVEERVRALEAATSNQGAEVRRILDAREVEWRRTLQELQRMSEERILALDRNYRELLKAQHAEFELSLAKAAQAWRERFDVDAARLKRESERVIHHELRLLRQRGLTSNVRVTSSSQPESDFDYLAFSLRFRGSEEHVRSNQAFYVPHFRELGKVLDLGCGQGEFLEVMRDAGILASGIDRSAEAVANCRAKGLDAEKADMFAYLSDLPDFSQDAMFSSQVVEHLTPAQLPEMIRLCVAKLRRGGTLAIETPNPQCLAIFATHFYLDPTHVRPVPSALLAFYLEENGMGSIDVHTRFPAAESFPELSELPERVRNTFFGGMDYAIFATKL